MDFINERFDIKSICALLLNFNKYYLKNTENKKILL